MARVLVTRISSFGDVAMLVPVIYSVAAKYPHDRFSVLTRKSFAPLFEGLGFNVNVITYDLNKKHKGAFGLLRMIRKLSGSKFSHVADMHDVLRSKAIRTSLRFSGCKVRKIHKGRAEKSLAIQNQCAAGQLTPTVERYLDVFTRLGFPAKISFENLMYFAPRSFHFIQPLTGDKTGKWIGIAPFAKHAGKIYPVEKMEKVVANLSANENHSIFLFGAGPEENAVMDGWCEKYPNVKSISSKLKLENELLLMSMLDVMVSMDSANMHLASLVQTPVVSIWGATHPYLGFYGYNQDFDNAIQIGKDQLDCRPCSVFGDIPCRRGDYACLNWITEQSVIDKVNRVLDKSRK